MLCPAETWTGSSSGQLWNLSTVFVALSAKSAPFAGLANCQPVRAARSSRQGTESWFFAAKGDLAVTTATFSFPLSLFFTSCAALEAFSEARWPYRKENVDNEFTASSLFSKEPKPGPGMCGYWYDGHIDWPKFGTHTGVYLHRGDGWAVCPPPYRDPSSSRGQFNPIQFYLTEFCFHFPALVLLHPNGV